MKQKSKQHMQEEFNKYHAMYGDKYIQQLELETQNKEQAENVLKASLEKAIGRNEASRSKIGEKLIKVAWKDCHENMQALLDTLDKPKRGVVPAYTPLLEWLADVYKDKLADLVHLITLSSLSTLLNSAFIPKNSSISAVSLSISDTILREATIEDFFNWSNEQEVDVMKGYKLEKSFEDGIKKRVQQSYRIAYAVNRMNQHGYQGRKWNKEIRQKLGAKLMELAIQASGMFELKEVEITRYDHIRTENNSLKLKNLLCVVPTEWLAKTWQKNTDLLSKYAHSFIPTIIPPKDWDSPYGGGYYGAYQNFASLLRLQGGSDNIFVKQYKRKLASVDLSYIYKALNAMQQTPFKINQNILEISEKIMASGGCLGGFPQTEPYPQLPELTGDYTEEELKDHKKKMVAIIKRNQARQSKALRALMALTTARKFVGYDKIYFPWNMDYRGRCYPIPTSLSPQGDDITKALLSFAEPAPCEHEDDWKWLAIHGANLAGHDKISFAERIKWVQDNTTNIIASANDPLGYTWWSKEAENDYPMEFLAFCFEWKNLKEYLTKNNNSCIGFKSGIAIAFDGTCSGLQHFSAILRDEIGGHAVNLTPTDKVQDIYSIVADKVNIVLTKDAKSGTADEWKIDKNTGDFVLDNTGKKIPKLGTKTMAQQWLIFAKDKFGTDGITRKVCKRSVMTLAYGSGRYGFKENLIDDTIKPFMQAHPDTHPFIQPTQTANYMAGLIWDAVSTTVVKAVEGMKYLQDLAKLICKGSNVVTWVTPNGLPVQQNYMEVKQQVFQMRISGAKHRFYNQEETGNIDSRGQAQGIAPNFIHSMDACHLQRVVVASYDVGNRNFAMIHDSFGTDIAHAGKLFKIIREQFVRLYENQNHLKNFFEDTQYLLDNKSLTKVPDVPAFGNLVLKDVVKSDFCFA